MCWIPKIGLMFYLSKYENIFSMLYKFRCFVTASLFMNIFGLSICEICWLAVIKKCTQGRCVRKIIG